MPKTFLPLLILSLVACWIEVDISAPGFPAMAKYFAVSEQKIQLTIAYNFLGFCLAALFWGPLSDCYGRRKIMVIGNGALAIGAALCTIAPNIELLLFARFIQGIGASTSAIVASAMIADSYRGDESSKLIGIMNTAATVLIAIAPVAGSFINQYIGWRGNYIVVAIISVISFILLTLALPETKKEFTIFSSKKVLSDYKNLLLSPQFFSASAVPSLLYSASMAFVASAAFLYTETFGLNLFGYAIHQTAIIISFACISLFFVSILAQLGSRNCIITGIIMCAIGIGLLVLLGVSGINSPYLTTACMMVFAPGFAMVYPPVFALSLEIFPEIKGTASSLIMSVRALMVSIFVGLSSYLYDGKLLKVALVMALTIIVAMPAAIYLLASNKKN